MTAPNLEVITGHWRLTDGQTLAGWHLLRKDEDEEYSSTGLGLMISCDRIDRGDVGDVSTSWLIGDIFLTDEGTAAVKDVRCVGTSSGEIANPMDHAVSWTCHTDEEGAERLSEIPTNITCVADDSSLEGGFHYTHPSQLLSVSDAPLRDLGGIYQMDDSSMTDTFRATWHAWRDGRDREPTHSIYFNDHGWTVENLSSGTVCSSASQRLVPSPTLVPSEDWNCSGLEHDSTRAGFLIVVWSGVKCYEVDMDLVQEWPSAGFTWRHLDISAHDDSFSDSETQNGGDEYQQTSA